MNWSWPLCALAVWSIAPSQEIYAGTFAFELHPVTVSLPPGAWYPDWVVPLDFNSDGNLDVVITRAAQNTYPATYAAVVALKNLGNGEFTDVSSNALGGVQTVGARDLRLADFDGDGRTDLFIADTGTDTSPFPGGQSLLLTQTADGTLRNDT